MMDDEINRIKLAVKDALQHFDFEKLQEQQPTRQQLIEYKQVSVVLDVGANIGQYASKVRQQGFQGRIISFEPMSKEFRLLCHFVSNDPNWSCKQLAIGAYDGVCTINIAGNSYSSSILPMLKRHIDNAPDSAYVDREMVWIARLDSIKDEIVKSNERVYLKMDVQGYEMEVLKGAPSMLKQVEIIELELSVSPLYENQVLYEPMMNYLSDLGFDLVCMERGFSDLFSGEVLQFDGIFIRR